jgi:hypothetical protein
VSDPRLAALWLDALQRLVGRAAHEVNNALNGVVVNLEVVRGRATPGTDAGRVAQFAEAAVEQIDAASALIAPLLALARAPRGGAPEATDAATDVALLARQVAALLAPAVAHNGVVVDVDAPPAAPAPGDPLAVRTAVTVALLEAAEAWSRDAAAADAVELAGADPAGEPSRPVRCTVSAAPDVRLQVSSAKGFSFPAEAAATLAGGGVDVVSAGDVVIVTFRTTRGAA